MGQAFDKDGVILGEVFGATKREVFDKLNEQFKDAHEIRVRSVVANPPSAELPRYKCHKEVWALKLRSVAFDHPLCVLPGDALLTPEDTTYAPFLVRREYTEKHKPTAGGYYVVYKDGYKSFSPAYAFEDGYARV